MAGLDVKWFEHNDPVVVNAFAVASEYVQTNPPVYKAYQAGQDLALNVGPQSTTYLIPTGHWLVINGANEISVYSDADFQSLYELKT